MGLGVLDFLAPPTERLAPHLLTPDTYHLTPIEVGEVTKSFVSRSALERRTKGGESPVGENERSS